MAAQGAQGGFVDAVASVIAPTGFYIAALGTEGNGPAAARAFLSRDTLNPKSRMRLVVVRLDVSADGNDGYSYGYLDVIRPNGDTIFGQYKAYWRRDASGRWAALGFGRGPREAGALGSLPDSLSPTATWYKTWPSTDSLSARETLKAAEIAFSDSSAKSIGAAFMAFAAPDAAKIDGSAYVFGPKAIGRQFDNPPQGFAGIAWHAEQGTISGSNDLGFNVGPVMRRGSPGASGGRFFTIWKRQPNGEWKYLVD